MYDKVTTTTVVVHDVKYLEGNSRTKMQRRFTLPTLCVPSTCVCVHPYVQVPGTVLRVPVYFDFIFLIFFAKLEGPVAQCLVSWQLNLKHQT